MNYNPKPLVATGVALLDSHRQSVPELERWEHSIDLETLDMNRGDSCVLGQLFGHYSLVTKPYFSRQPRMGLDEGAAISCGFHHDEDSPIFERDQYIALTTEWKRVIEARLAA